MKKVVSALLLSCVATGASAQDSFRQARDIALEVISAELAGGICTPAVPTAAQRQSVRDALARIDRLGLTDETGLDPLNLAVLSDDPASLQRLGRLGYPLEPAGAMLLGASLHDSRQALAYLLSKGADPDWTNEYGATALMDAASNGRIEVAQALIAAGASPNVRNRDGVTALHYALGCRNQPMVDLLVAAGAVADVKAEALARKHGMSLSAAER